MEETAPAAAPVAAPETETAAETVADTVAMVAAAADEAAATSVETVAEAPSGTESCPAGGCAATGIVIAAIVVLVVVIAALCRRGKGKCSCCEQPADGKTPGKAVEIYVGNLSYSMTEEQLRKEFERFGVVKSSRIIGHHGSGKSKGYGFIEMPHRKEAEIAISKLNNREVMGRKLRVNEARHGIPRA